MQHFNSQKEMVINNKYQFIFIHIPKSAGTSVMNGLSVLPGNNRKWLGPTKHETWLQFSANAPARRGIINKITGLSFEGYTKFAFVRNPWDRMASFYRYLKEIRPRHEIDTVDSFKEFLRQADAGTSWIKGLHSMKQQITYFINSDGILELDFLGHFEHLSEDFRTITDILSCPAQLPHNNKSSNTTSDYRLDYDDQMVEIITRLFPDDISTFGYDFEHLEPAKRFSSSIYLGLDQRSKPHTPQSTRSQHL